MRSVRHSARSWRLGHRLLAAGALALPLALVGCGGSSSPTTDTPANFPDSEHPHVVLKDRLGNQLAANSTEPYSPRETCGSCHNVDHVAKGYHFQQGRTDSTGTLIVKEDYFNDGRDYLISPGMYGKW